MPKQNKALPTESKQKYTPNKAVFDTQEILKEDCCDFCGESETSGHILWSCKIAKETWSGLGFNIDITPPTPRELFDVLWLLMDSSREKYWELFAIAAWCLWNNRNTVWHGRAGKLGKSITEEARKYQAEVWTALPSNGKLPMLKIIHKQWSPPPQGQYKVNVDATVFKEKATCGIGVVIRNYQGRIMGAMYKKVEFPLGKQKPK